MKRATMAPNLITPSYTDEELDEQFPHLTYAERLPFHEFDVMEAAKKIARRYVATVASIEEAQKLMIDRFQNQNSALAEQGRVIFHSADDLARHLGYEDIADYDHYVRKHSDDESSIFLSEDGSVITLSAYPWTEYDAPVFSVNLNFPFSEDDFNQAWINIRDQAAEWVGEFGGNDSEDLACDCSSREPLQCSGHTLGEDEYGGFANPCECPCHEEMT